MSADQWYFQQLPKAHREAYHAILTGLMSLSEGFQVPGLTMQELSDVFFQVRLDHPEIFWASGFSCRAYQNAQSYTMVPEYLFRKKQIIAHQQAMESRIARLIRPAKELTEPEKEKYIHDFICEKVHYDKLKKPYSHEIIGPLGQGVSVCEGIAKTVKMLADRLGLWCMIALSENNPEKGIRYRHTWNILKLGGSYYHLDATFDNTLSDENGIRYDYFNLSDAQIFRDHETPVWKLPACTDSGRFYYKEKKLSFTKPEEVRSRAAQAVRKKKPLIFQWRGGYLTREKLMELYGILQEEAAGREQFAALKLNWPQAVLEVNFLPAKPEEAVIMQEANEEETAGNTEPEAEKPEGAGTAEHAGI